MVVLLPYFAGEKLKGCNRCSHLGLASPRTPRSSFRKRTRNTDGFELHCRGCSKRIAGAWRARDGNGKRTDERSRQNRQERRADMTAEEREEQRRYQREWCRKKTATDPKYRARRATSQKRYAQKRVETLGEEAVRELQRMTRKDREWRRGAKVPTLEEVRKRVGYCGHRYPLEPFREWLREGSRQARIEDGLPDTGRTNSVHMRVAFALQVTERRIHAWLHDSKDPLVPPADTVDATTVDRAASRHGETTLAQIYWDYGRIKLYGPIAVYCWDRLNAEPKVLQALSGGFNVYHWKLSAEEEVKVSVIQEPTRARRCRSPHGTLHCEGTAGEGSRFCGFCAGRLAKVKADLEGQAHAFRKSIKKKNARPTCCNPACKEPRVRGDRYCFTCQEEGWDEDDIE